MDTRTSLLLLSMACLAFPAMAQVYKTTDEDGNVTYTDESSSGAEKVRVKSPTTVTLPKPEDVQRMISENERRENAEEEEQSQPYDRVSINAPADEEAFHSGSGDVEFRVSSSPGLRQDHRYQLDLDGAPVGEGRDGRFMVRNMDRGTHNASVHVVDPSGRRIQTGDQIRFTVHRPSVLN